MSANIFWLISWKLQNERQLTSSISQNIVSTPVER